MHNKDQKIAQGFEPMTPFQIFVFNRLTHNHVHVNRFSDVNSVHK